MPSTYPLNVGRSATVNAQGIARVEFGPNGLETWQVSKIGVLVSSAISEPTAKVYVDSESPENYLGGTFTGSNDASNESQTLRQGQKLICVWSLADVGASATLSIFGTTTK